MLVPKPSVHQTRITTFCSSFHFKNSPRFSAAAMGPGDNFLPKVVAFDLDATLWMPEMYQLWGGSPFKRDPSGVHLLDRQGTKVYLMGHSREILEELASHDKWKENVIIAYVSRCDEPEWARECLHLFEIAQGVTMHTLAKHHEIYGGSKKIHFQRLHKKTKIAYKDMLFFDNESYNIRDVSPLGVTCIYTPRGMTQEKWTEGLDTHAKKLAG